MSRDSRLRRRGRDTDGSSVCYNCNETGNISRDCSQRGGRGGNRFLSIRFSSPVDRSSTCNDCNQSGHISRDYTHNEQGEWGGGRGGRRGRGGRGRSCFNCDEVGHIARDCPQRGSGERGRGGRRVVVVGGRGLRGRVSFNFTRLGGRGRGAFRGRSFESEVKPTHIFFDDDDD